MLTIFTTHGVPTLRFSLNIPDIASLRVPILLKLLYFPAVNSSAVFVLSDIFQRLA